MKNFLATLLCFFATFAIGHNVNYEHVALRQWSNELTHESITGSFYMYKNGEVYLENEHNQIQHFPLSAISKNDQEYVNKRVEAIEALNFSTDTSLNTKSPLNGGILLFSILSLLSILFGIFIVKNYRHEKIRYVLPVAFLAFVFSIWGFTKKAGQIQTDPNEMDLAFIAFKPSINTFWDATYFHVESKGIPDHEMMTGITAWQQQVPIPQCYTGANSWSIPLNPVIADTAVPVNTQHFLRGAVAVAVNGVAIFNPYTNTGVDAFLDGQLDIYGGHCGRADDYHYHIAPTVLYTSQEATLPIAYALDGFAIYGAVEPDGSAMLTLDENHGHYGINGVYHYHGTSSAPYMIGKMVGQITEDNTMQIIPQAAAHPIRPSLTPLNGAVITGCVPNGNNSGYTLTYTRNGSTYHVNFSWTLAGQYTFNFISPTDTVVENYTGFTQCDIVAEIPTEHLENKLLIFPNPNGGNFEIAGLNEHTDVSEQVTIFTLSGTTVFSCKGIPAAQAIPKLSSGVYIVSIKSGTSVTNHKVVVN